MFSANPRLQQLLNTANAVIDGLEEEETEEESEIVTEKVTLWNLGPNSYAVKLKLQNSCDYDDGLRHVSAILYSGSEIQKKNKIGSLSGTLLSRPTPYFHEMADSDSSELEWLASLFCDSKGHATKVSTNLSGQDVNSGGFLHLDVVEVEKAHMGHDLGLRLIHETLVFLKHKWNLAVMCPTFLKSHVDFNEIPKSEREEKRPPLGSSSVAILPELDFNRRGGTLMNGMHGI
jgi:hypothetical protein